MIFIATYMLYRAPSLIKSTKTALRQIKAVFMVHGLADGVAVLWRKLRILELLTFTWITMFLMVLYVELIDKVTQIVFSMNCTIKSFRDVHGQKLVEFF